MSYLIVFLGGGIGAALRYGVNVGAARLFGTAFPYGTMAVNVTGSLAMGLLVGFFAFKARVPLYWQLFLTTGVLGGYTTFSAFSADAIMLYGRGQVLSSIAYVLGSVALGLIGLIIGLAVVRALA